MCSDEDCELLPAVPSEGVDSVGTSDQLAVTGQAEIKIL